MSQNLIDSVLELHHGIMSLEEGQGEATNLAKYKRKFIKEQWDETSAKKLSEEVSTMNALSRGFDGPWSTERLDITANYFSEKSNARVLDLVLSGEDIGTLVCTATMLAIQDSLDLIPRKKLHSVQKKMKKIFIRNTFYRDIQGARLDEIFAVIEKQVKNIRVLLLQSNGADKYYPLDFSETKLVEGTLNKYNRGAA